MTPTKGRYLLDTCMLIHMIRGSALALAVDQRHGLRANTTRPLISVVTVGECRAFGRKNNWGEKKRSALDELLRQFVVVDINNEPILNQYAEIDAFCQAHGRALSKNDLWIAATASVTRALLLTTDLDFDPLHDQFLSREYFDPEQYRT